MKIFINTITPEDTINAIEAADKATADVKVGEPSKELTDAKVLAESASCPTISDKVFPVGEWIHIEDADALAMETELAKYPAIKEAHVVLEEKMKQAIEEKGLGSFASALKTTVMDYKQESPEIVDAILKLAPIKIEG